MADANEEYVIDIMVNAIDNAKSTLAEAQAQVTKFQEVAKQTQLRTQQMSRTPFEFRIKALDQASSAIDRIANRGMNLMRSPYRVTVGILDKATAPLRKIMDMATSYQGFMLGAAVGVGGAAGVALPIRLADQQTQSQIAFNTMLGQKAGPQFYRQMQQFAIATPFSQSQVVGDAQHMLAMGFNYKQVLPALQSIGDASAATGGGAAGVERISTALGQMMNNGHVDAQDMNQLTNANLPAWQILAQALHTNVADARKKSQSGDISSTWAVNQILAGLEKRYGGQMQANSTKTAGGLLSQISDTLQVGFVTKWGAGLQKGLIPELTKFNDWLGTNQKTLDKWGADLQRWGQQGAEWFTGKVNGTISAVDKLTQSSAWKDTPTFWGKMQVGWDDLVAKPFDKWWAGPGETEVRKIAGDVGTGFGSFLHDAISVPLNLLGGKSAFADAGQTAGGAFFDKFLKAFDAKQLASKAGSAFNNLQPWHAQTTAGGAVRTGLDLYLGAAVLGLLTHKVKGGIGTLSDVKGAYKWTRKVFSRSKGVDSVTSKTPGKRTAVGTKDNKTSSSLTEEKPKLSVITDKNGIPYKSTLPSDAVNTSSKAVEELSKGSGAVSKLSKYANVLKPLNGMSKVLGPLSLIYSGIQFANSNTAKGKGQVVGSTIGGWGGAEAGMAAGAAIGSVVPGLGTAIGAIVGGLAGGFGGGELGNWLGGDIGSLFRHKQPVAPLKQSTVSPTQTPSAKQSIQINLGGIKNTYDIKSDTPEQIMNVINAHESEIAEKTAKIIAQGLERVHANTPVPPKSKLMYGPAFG
jgi:tape measure domain-containing protein